MSDPGYIPTLEQLRHASIKSANTARRKAKGRAKAQLAKIGIVGVSAAQLAALLGPRMILYTGHRRFGKRAFQDGVVFPIKAGAQHDKPPLIAFDEFHAVDFVAINRAYHSHMDYPDPPQIKHAFVSRRERREPTKPKGYQPPAWVTRKQRR
jgi:hypothetical protein